MTKKQSRNFSAEAKTKIVLEILREELTISQLSAKYEVTARAMQNWKKQFLNNASLAFEPAKGVSEYKEQIDKLKDQNDELAKALGKATVERDWAVGKLNSLGLSNKKSLVAPKLQMLSKARQCKLLKISRSVVYYKAKVMSPYNLSILNRPDTKDRARSGKVVESAELRNDFHSYGNCVIMMSKFFMILVSNVPRLGIIGTFYETIKFKIYRLAI